MATWCVLSLERTLYDLPLFEDGRSISMTTLDTTLNQLEIVYRELAGLDATGELSTNETSALLLVGQALEKMQQLEDVSINVPATTYSSPLVCEGVVGRPQYMISQNTIELLIGASFTVSQIADMLSVSVRMLRRRMSDYELLVRATYSTIFLQQLDTVISSIQQKFPLCGYRQMIGHLRAQGLRVQQNHVRESKEGRC